MHSVSSEALRGSELLALARRRRRTLAWAGAVGAVLGVVWMVVAPPGYTSSSLVLAQGKPVGGKLAESEAEIAASGAVLGMAALQLDGLSVDALAKQVGAKPEGSTMVRVSARARERGEAQRIAIAVTDAYLRYAAELSAKNATAATTELIPLRDNLRLQLDTSDIRIAEKRNEPLLPATAPSPELAVRMPVPQIEALEAERARVLEDLGLVEQGISRELAADPPHTIVSAANLPGPVGPLRWIGTVLLTALALPAAAMVLLLWRARRDPRIHHAHEIAAACGAPLTAVLPGPGSGLDPAREQAHYESAAARVLGTRAGTEEVAQQVTLVTVEGDTAGAAAAARVARAAGGGAIRVASVSGRWPIVDDPRPGEGVFMVVGGGALTPPTLLAVGGALRDASAAPPAGVLVAESSQGSVCAEPHPTRTGG